MVNSGHWERPLRAAPLLRLCPQQSPPVTRQPRPKPRAALPSCGFPAVPRFDLAFGIWVFAPAWPLLSLSGPFRLSSFALRISLYLQFRKNSGTLSWKLSDRNVGVLVVFVAMERVVKEKLAPSKNAGPTRVSPLKTSVDRPATVPLWPSRRSKLRAPGPLRPLPFVYPFTSSTDSGILGFVSTQFSALWRAFI